jgi:hypothetical protein
MHNTGKRPHHLQVCMMDTTNFLMAINRLLSKHTVGHIQPTAVTDVNIHCVKKLILENRQIKVHDIASKVCLNAGSIKTSICEHVLFKKVYTWWVPKMLMFDQKAQHVSVSADHLNQTELERHTFSKHTLTSDKTWVHYFTPE